jgi:hypothetical protein
LIAGPRFAPQAFRDTTLEKLLPVRIDPTFLGTYREVLTEPYGVAVTPAGARHRIFSFGGRSGQRPSLGGLYWIARTLGVKPGAEVLLRQKAPDDGVNEGLPLVVLGRYGAGRVFFSATDETWRWRRGGDEWLFDAFWLEVCRALAIPRDVGADDRVTLRTDRSRYRFGERVEVRAEVNDWELLAGLGDALETLVREDDGTPVGGLRLDRLGPESQQFEGWFLPPRAGSFTAAIEGLPMDPGVRAPSASFHVAEADVELREPRADLEALRRLARGTGGMEIGLDEIATKAAAIRDRSIQIPDDVEEPLWDSRLALGAFGLILVTEWVLRKYFGMV